MSYNDFTTTKECRWCHKAINVRDSRTDLCGDCKFHKVDIDRVMAGRSYSLATQEDYKRVIERVSTGATKSVGPFKYIK